MKITGFLWLDEYVEKLENKHTVYVEEVEEVFANQPQIRHLKRGRLHGEDLYRALGQTDEGRYLAVFFIYKRTGKVFTISARAIWMTRSAEVMVENKKVEKDVLPENFDSVEELWEFWDTHSSADYEDEMDLVEFEIQLESNKTYLPIAKDLYPKLRVKARAQGISLETLVNLWLQEKLAELA